MICDDDLDRKIRSLFFKSFDVAKADEERDGSEDAEAGVNEPPQGWDATERAGYESEGKHSQAGDKAELENPLVADGVTQRTEEDYGEDEVGEGEPVGSVGEERVVDAVLVQRVVDANEPEGDPFREDCVRGGEGG